MALFTKLILIFFAVLIGGHAKALSAHDQKMIDRAAPHFELLNKTINDIWPELPAEHRTFFPAQIEQESLWNQYAQLCVPKPSCARELGIGFGQFTITPRMNVWQEATQSHPKLRGWKWEDRFDAEMQFIAIVVKDKGLYQRCRPLMDSDAGGMSCTASSYNGGFGGFQADRRLCGNTEGCNPRRWYGHIELTSTKAKTAVQGYGHSFYQINRDYVRLVQHHRARKYVDYMRG